ncbi:hypothetical protein WMY93_010518 [Mugilogobius chulae]|uniref:Uncharacterized protein n=1 Tax=Mugilogobius chulae TaxID=88201 RepID=A0AAW0PGL1_9GOBI
MLGEHGLLRLSPEEGDWCGFPLDPLLRQSSLTSTVGEQWVGDQMGTWKHPREMKAEEEGEEMRLEQEK